MQTKLVLKQPTTLKLRFQPGATGPSGTLAIGTVTTGAPGSSVVITNVGTATAAILDITIPRGDVGATGDKGWSPILAVVTDGARRVLQVSDWTGGEGTKPASGSYIGPAGLVVAIGDAVDIRGAQGPSGSVTDGDKGDVVVSSSGAVWTVDAGVIDNSKLATMATARIKGRVTAGTGAPEDLTAAQVKTFLGTTSAGDAMNTAVSAAAQTALLSALVGDSGSGGTKGLAPAPAAGDTAAKKYLSASGAWSSPDASGAILQTVYAEYTSYFNIDASATPAQAIPADDTIPQQTEGAQVVTVSITPQFSTSKLRIRGEIPCAGSNAIVMALFRDSGANAIGSDVVVGTGGFITKLGAEVEVAASSTSATTIKMRVGPSSGTAGFNGNTVGRLMGGTLRASLIVEEIKA